MKAVILAGGEGTRLRPLTCNIPKPMVPVVNKPMMQHIIELLKRNNLVDIAITLQYMPEVIKDFFGDGKGFGVSLRYYTEDSPLGTAGSVKNAEDFLNDTFVVISGDILTDINLEEAIEFHKRKSSYATIILTKVDVPLEYGIVISGDDGRITRFLEKPNWGEVFSDTVNTGIYILEPEVLDLFNKNQVFDFSKDLFPLMLKHKLPIYGYVTEDYWCDIGDLRAYHHAHIDIFEGKVKVDIPGYKNGNNVWIGEDSRIDLECVINGPIVIGKNVKIKKGVIVDSFSIIGDNCVLNENCSIKRSIIWRNCSIGKRVQLRGSIVCDKVYLKEKSSVFEHSVIGSSTVIMDGAIIKPNVKIWPNKTVDSAVEVNSNLIWGTRFTKSLFGTRGVLGKVNIDITPEFASKLSAAFGATFSRGAKIGVSYDGTNPSFMIHLAVISGLLSSGVKVYNFNRLLLPMMRLAVKFYGLNGGIHVATPDVKEGQAIVEFLENNGSNISKNLERKIENVFSREDFIRCEADDINCVNSISNFSSFYIRNIVNRIKSTKPINIKLVINLESDLIQSVLNVILKELGCKVEYINVKGSLSKRYGEPWDELSYFSNYVKYVGVDLGAWIDNTSEKIILVDEFGRIIKEDMYLAVIGLILFKKYRGCTFVVPFSVSDVMEKIAKQYNGKIVRTKTSIQEIMKELNSSSETEVMEEQFAFYFDALESLIKIIDFMNMNRLKLSQIVDMIPDFYVTKKVVECPWEIKGRVMRELIEDRNNGRVELFEGVKVYEDGGWVLVLPDSDKPVCKVIGEGMNEEFAEELTDMYVKKIKEVENKRRGH